MIAWLRKRFAKSESAADPILREIRELKPGTPEWEMIEAAMERNPDKPFQEEWERTVALQTYLIQRFGDDGVKFLYGRKAAGDLFALGELPEDCPWAALNQFEPADAIREIFAPLANSLPRTIRALEDNCVSIVAERVESDWRLHYSVCGKLHTGDDYFWHYVGGAPTPKPERRPSLVRFGWKFPADLIALYSLHDGFGCSDRTYVLPSERVVVMADYMNPIVKDVGKSPDGYRYEDLLEFCPDGAGNAQCFRREGDKVAGTVDWDHETWEISGNQSFFDFIDEHLSQLHEE